MSDTILSAGFTRIWAGLLSPARGLRAEGVETVFFRFCGNEQYTVENHDFRVVEASPFLPVTLRQWHRLIRQLQPRHIDFYPHRARWPTLWGMLVMAKAMNVPVVPVCVGNELLNFPHPSRLMNAVIRRALRQARLVIVKELYMTDVVRQHIPEALDKLRLVHNCIPLGPMPDFGRQEQRILFLNIFKKFRRAHLLVEAAPMVLKRFPCAKFDLIGAGRYPGYEAGLRETADRLGVGHAVTVHPFIKDPRPFYEKASIFALPADIVFCNNALLEAMERGVPPIVADVPGAERIVAHGVSGLRVAQTAEAIADAICSLLADEAYRLRLARGARRRIEAEFDEKKRTQALLKYYREEVWREAATAPQPADGQGAG